MRVMIVVTHLLGTGHLARALTLADHFHQAGDAVCVVSGGVPVPRLHRPDIPLIQLPPVRSDGVDFSRLLTDDGEVATESTHIARRTGLLGAFDDFAPDVLITELFPFGRRILRKEFGALLDHARGRVPAPLILCSIRDILAPPSKPEKAERTQALIAAHYDGVLVHSDAALMPLEQSWPVTPDLATKLRYTGFVAPPAPPLHPDALGHAEILVSAGGGDVGDTLFRAAIDAARLDPRQTFRVLVGGSNAADRVADLQAGAPDNAIVEPTRADYRQMLNHTRASVSLCGYNTALDVLQTGCPAIFVPFDAGNEVEQGIRARHLARQPQIEMITAATLSPARLLSALDTVLAQPTRQPVRDGMHGAARTRTLVAEMLAQ